MTMVRPGTKLRQGKAKVVDGVMRRGCDGKKDKTNQPQISSSIQLALRGRREEGRGQRLSSGPEYIYGCVCVCARLCACDLMCVWC